MLKDLHVEGIFRVAAIIWPDIAREGERKETPDITLEFVLASGDVVEGDRPALDEIVHPRARPGDGSGALLRRRSHEDFDPERIAIDTVAGAVNGVQ